MDIQVKDLGVVEEKSRAEVEEQLLKKHEEKFEDNAQPTDSVNKIDMSTPVEESKPEAVEDEKPPVPELNDTDVLSYIKERYKFGGRIICGKRGK